MTIDSASLPAAALVERKERPVSQWLLAAFFVGIGLASGWISRTYAFGTPARMGPGFFPTWIGLILAAVGVLIAVAPALPAPDAGDTDRAPVAARLRIMAAVLGSLLVFAIATPALGLPAGVMALVLTALLAQPALTLPKALVFAVLLAALASALFVGGLGLPFALLPS